MSPNSSAPPPVSRARRAGWFFLFIPLVLGVVGWWSWGGAVGAPPSSMEPSPVEGAQAGGAPVEAPPKVGPSGAGAVVVRGPSPSAQDLSPVSPEQRERLALRELWGERLERAKRTLESYVAATRYPPQSRSLREQPDQVEMAEPERTRPLSREHPDVQLRLKQDRVFVVGDETVRLFVSCEDAQRSPRPCEVLSASAHEAEHMGSAVPPIPVAFTDDGAVGDALARDGIYTGTLQPSKQGFPLYSGTIRVNVRVRSGKAEGMAFLDILYTHAVPATFTGRVREVLSEGSLLLYLGIHVRKAGRYVVAGRMDDESGVPFAHVSFNEELREGPQEVKLTVFGKLILDEVPTFPLKLRDVEGFLLKETGDPDRELMTALRGYVHTTNAYPASSFSPAEWQSEERTRYIDEYTRDMNEAQRNFNATFEQRPPP
ncbi:choice-of-anchor X domain-containing protein [Myxococcus stipitatus]|uniref:choice-of-anchor X domain-containing protein n=1 Tax=Myxococcus stipitatus TaxID=83455 RepID=UPI0030CD367A